MGTIEILWTILGNASSEGGASGITFQGLADAFGWGSGFKANVVIYGFCGREHTNCIGILQRRSPASFHQISQVLNLHEQCGLTS